MATLRLRGTYLAPSSSPFSTFTRLRPLSSVALRTYLFSNSFLHECSKTNTSRSLQYLVRFPTTLSTSISNGISNGKKVFFSKGNHSAVTTRKQNLVLKANPRFCHATRESNEQSLLVSVVLPVFNELGCVAVLVEKIGHVMRGYGAPYEIICVDDGSTDGCSDLLKAMSAERDDLSVVILKRNFGQTAAMAAGFDYAVGDVIVTMDADMQNDPTDIPLLINRLLDREGGGGGGGGEGEDEDYQQQQEPIAAQLSNSSQIQYNAGFKSEGYGFDMVCGWRNNRKDNLISRNFPSFVANWLIGFLTGVKLHDYGCSLKAYRASLIANIRLYGEMHRFIPAIAFMEGASISEIQVKHHARKTGNSKYNLSRIPRVIMDLITLIFFFKYRDRPMHLMGTFAIISLSFSLLFSIQFLSSFFSCFVTYGFAMALSNAMGPFMAALELLILGFQFVCLGLLAEVCIRTYYESQPRPVYRVQEVASSPLLIK